MLRLEQWELAMFRGEAAHRCGGCKSTVILIYRAHLALGALCYFIVYTVYNINMFCDIASHKQFISNKQ